MSGKLPEENLWAQYDRSLDEYRFQVELNWKRTQYFFALNVATLAAGAGLLAGASGSQRIAVVTLFLVGAALACFSIAAGRTQKGYYQQARDLVKTVQGRLPVDGLEIQTTPGLGSARPRWRSVSWLQDRMFALIAVADLAGLVVAVT